MIILFFVRKKYEKELEYNLINEDIGLMKEYDFVIIGGGCAFGLSLAYELDLNKLNDKNLRLLKLEEIKEIKHRYFGSK